MQCDSASSRCGWPYSAQRSSKMAVGVRSKGVAYKFSAPTPGNNLAGGGNAAYSSPGRRRHRRWRLNIVPAPCLIRPWSARPSPAGLRGGLARRAAPNHCELAGAEKALLRRWDTLCPVTVLAGRLDELAPVSLLALRCPLRLSTSCSCHE